MWWTLLLFFLFILIYYLLAKSLASSRSIFTPQSFEYYRKKSRLLNNSEQALYINLVQELGDSYLVFSKVRIEDFVSANQSGIARNISFGNRGRIKSRHVDFLICDKSDTRPVMAIELDGGSHQNWDRFKRDNFVDDLYRQIDIPIKHIPVGSNFINEVMDIKEILTFKI